MKVAVSTDGQDLKSQVSPVFGRCPYFTLVEVEDGEITGTKLLENTAMEQSSGAGTAAVQLIGEEGADCVISGAVGPKAFSALNKWEIEVFKAEPETVEENVKSLISGDLEETESATGPAGMGRGGGSKGQE